MVLDLRLQGGQQCVPVPQGQEGGGRRKQGIKGSREERAMEEGGGSEGSRDQGRKRQGRREEGAREEGGGSSGGGSEGGGRREEGGGRRGRWRRDFHFHCCYYFPSIKAADCTRGETFVT